MRYNANPTEWKIVPFDYTQVHCIAESTGLSPLIAHLLLLRGIQRPEEMIAFLRPSLSQLGEPFELANMDRAVSRIHTARDKGEPVLVFGDYDVDGIAAAAILQRGLRRFGISHVECDMPDRFSEGYGIMPHHIAMARDKGYRLIITVDNGITAHEAAVEAQRLGVDIIVTDHHALEEVLPPAIAVINPKRGPVDHPTYMLAGAGVALKLATALTGVPHDLDIAALGTIADIVPLLGENRVIAALGIRHMIKYKRVGIAQLARIADFDIGNVTAQKIAFQLAPRLNAAGRLETGHAALNLLMTESEEEAKEMAAVLNATNEERRAIEQAIYEEAVETLDAFLSDEQRSIVLAKEPWHKGVIGIVASRILARYQRPVIICCLGGDSLLHGSGRSYPGFNMVEALHACRRFLVKFGGHAGAAGLTIEPTQLDAFRDAFEEEVRRQLGHASPTSVIEVDAIASLSQFDRNFIQQIQGMAPFGPGNPEPIFCAAGVEILHPTIQVRRDQHLKFYVRQENVTLPAIGFNMAERHYVEGLPNKADILFTPELNTFNGETTLQLNLKDIHPSL